MAAQPIPVNHHAGQSGFEGPIGLMVGLFMLLGGLRRARMAADLAGVTSADHVVDVGCGPGGVATVAARRGARVTGVDPSPMMLRLARTFVRGRRVRWLRGTAESLPVPDGSATVAWAVATIHHWPDIAPALAEIRRIVGSDGRFMAIERAVPAGATGLASHGWTEEQARSFADQCRAAGFAEIRVDRRDAGRLAFWIVRAP